MLSPETNKFIVPQFNKKEKKIKWLKVHTF